MLVNIGRSSLVRLVFIAMQKHSDIRSSIWGARVEDSGSSIWGPGVEDSSDCSVASPGTVSYES